MNQDHKVKQLGDWCVSKVLELIERLQNSHESQLLEIRGAFHGRGNLEVADRANIFRVTHEFCPSMDSDRRKNNFIKFRPRANTTCLKYLGWLENPDKSSVYEIQKHYQ